MSQPLPLANLPILNRTLSLPADGFYQFEAPGEHVNHAARVVQLLDPTAVASIVNRFTAEAADAGEEFSGMRIDKDHLSQSMENPTEALGWVMRMRNRDGIPEAEIAWTALGRPLIETKEGQPPVYKFFSTEYDPNQCQKIGTRIVNGKSYELVRPLRLAGLSLTNDPNNKGQRPIANREAAGSGLTQDPRSASQEHAGKLLNRAQELQKAGPRRTFDECWGQAKDELGAVTESLPAVLQDTERVEYDRHAAASITNRVRSLQATNPKRTFQSCWEQASSEHYDSTT
jgi:hypothetical protein